MPHSEDTEPEDPFEESSFGQHVILNPEKHSMALCSKCGAKFFWDSPRYVPFSKDVNLECPEYHYAAPNSA